MPHSWIGSFRNRFWTLEPKKKKLEFETPLDYYGMLYWNDVCTILWLLQLVKQVQSLSPFDHFQSSGHTRIHSLAGAISSVSCETVALFPHQTAWEWCQWVRCSAKIHVDARWSDSAVDKLLHLCGGCLTHKPKEFRSYVNSASLPLTPGYCLLCNYAIFNTYHLSF